MTRVHAEWPCFLCQTAYNVVTFLCREPTIGAYDVALACLRSPFALGEAAGLSDTELAWWTQARELACRRL